MTAEIQRIGLTDIRPNPDQPRRDFNPLALAELADSILANGLIQPITVRPLGDGFECVAGERRWRAHGLLVSRGHKRFAKIACHVRPMDDRQRDIEAIVENLARADVTPLEEANAYGRLVDAGMTPAEIAAATGQPVMRVNWRLSLLKLAPTYQRMLATEQIDRQTALELARLERPADQDRVFRLIRDGKAKGWGAVRAAVDTLAGIEGQTALFESAPSAKPDEIATLNAMERKIESVAGMVGAGWREGECVVASKVDPGRAQRMAEKIDAIQSALRIMGRELRNVSAQAHLAMGEDA